MKKLSLILAILMIVALFPFAISAEEATASVWDGTIPEADAEYAFSGGDGTEGNPYLISSAADLAMINALSATGETFEDVYFFLTVDITMNEDYANSADWGTTPPANNWTAIAVYEGTNYTLSTNAFRGHIDGGGHVIRGLYSKSDAEGHTYAVGLIGVLYGSVKNLGFENCYVEHNMESGIGAGVLATAIGHKNISAIPAITNCYVSNSTAKSWRWAGLICGVGQQVDVIDCYTQGNVVLGRTDNEADGGGIVGYLGMGGGMATIENCYTLATINEAGVTGPITGLADSISTVANCYYDSTITTVNKTWVHGDAKAFYEIIDISKADMTVDNMNFDDTVWEDSENGPVLTVFKNPMSTPPVTEPPADTEPPVDTEPTVTEPAATEPAATEPAATEPAATEPAATEPAATEPAGTDAPTTEPSSAPVGLIIGIVVAVVAVVVIVIVVAKKKAKK